ncbi:hypothetical protein FRACYDRAFT_265833 [Fragilariopsis cylindrus CCMP1102]|uniref:Uncharacterized protein n=1 Tax=Fragilariopsis cylindrus CCMP1102 TaxID=635003 RepID=A0A1E7EL21_9STRA|nr:hypothetical protein FRACYDRAFT_265833 [Fragilariopsis cylindrus CCMP1102]|eukprot:OEU06557.1 hypothetical protein FRACYDRAFT_265833 [Fragilariopsis cylindrus CCMP1102]
MAISYSPFGISSNTASAASAASTTGNNKLQRGKVLEKQFNEHDLLRAYREIQSEYRNKAFARKRTKRILAFGKREFVFVSVTGDKPLDDGTWVSGTVSVEFNETKTDSDSDSDNNEGDDENGNDTTTATTTTTSLPYRNKSYTRAFQDSIAFYKPIPPSAGGSASSSSSASLSGERTKLTIICRIDLNDSSSSTSDGGGGGGGCIPMWLYVKTIGITGARSVLNMRRALLEEEG